MKGLEFISNKFWGIVLALVAVGFAFTGVGIIATIVLGYVSYGLLSQKRDDI